MDALPDLIRGLEPAVLVPVLLLTVIVWFAPSLIAVFRNRANLGKIALVNVPAGISWVAWMALIAWAVSGKGTEAMPAALGNLRINWGWTIAGAIGLIILLSLALGVL